MQVNTKRTRDLLRDKLNRTVDPDTLKRLADVLGIPVAYLPEPARPYFGPDQVRFMCELVKGQTYRYVYGGQGNSWTFTVVEKPYFSGTKGEGPGWWVKVQGTPRGTMWDISLQDSNILPYQNGHWVGVNHIAFTDENRRRHPKHPECCCYHQCLYCPEDTSRGHHHHCC